MNETIPSPKHYAGDARDFTLPATDAVLANADARGFAGKRFLGISAFDRKHSRLGCRSSFGWCPFYGNVDGREDPDLCEKLETGGFVPPCMDTVGSAAAGSPVFVEATPSVLAELGIS